MNILIIGSSGFIGKNLYESLGKNHDVFGVDLISIGHKNFKKIKHIEDLENLENFKYFDFIINCTGSTDVKSSNSHPYNDFEKNTINVYKILSIIKKLNNEICYINISSGAIYGNTNKGPVNENDISFPVSSYGFNKKISEEICEHFSTTHNVNSYSLRIFSAYGPGLKKQLFWDLFKKSKANKKVELFGDKTDFRDFIYIDDICIFISLLLQNKHKGHLIFNVSSGIPTSIEQAASTFFKLLDTGIVYRFNGESLQGYPKGICGNNERAKSVGFIPKFNLEEGLIETIKWMKTQKK